jgi:hypothetical protein
MEAASVRRGVNRNGFYACLTAASYYADSDFPAIRNQNPFYQKSPRLLRLL